MSEQPDDVTTSTSVGLPSSPSPGINWNPYHERQRWALCALHTTNCLIQEELYTAQEFDDLALELSTSYYPEEGGGGLFRQWRNRYPFGLGNYDVNVVEVALSKAGYSLKWYDRRTPFPSLADPQHYCVGFIVSDPPNTFSLTRSRHFFALRKIGEHWYNLNSKLDSPYRFNSESHLLSWLQSRLDQNPDTFLIFVYFM